MILGLNGLKGAGKDTVAAYLIKEYGFERRAFADPLKKSIAALFDIPFHEIDKMKNDPNVQVVLGWQAPLTGFPEDEGRTEFRPQMELTFREFLQRYGTESHRGVFGEDFWLDYTLPKDGFYAGRKIAITDLRFDNEALRIQDCGGFTVRIERPGIEDNDQHESEQPLSDHLVNFVLYNDATLEALFPAVDVMIETLAEAA